MDNLESQVYEIFEKDPIKYQQYQKAIAQALIDRVSEEEKLTKETFVIIKSILLSVVNLNLIFDYLFLE